MKALVLRASGLSGRSEVSSVNSDVNPMQSPGIRNSYIFTKLHTERALSRNGLIRTAFFTIRHVGCNLASLSLLGSNKFDRNLATTKFLRSVSHFNNLQ